MQKGKLILIVGPSGVGKGLLVNHLRERNPNFVFPQSATTREKREGEGEKQYLFLGDSEFDAMNAKGDFLEVAKIHASERYATLKQPILDAIEEGKIVIREVDIQGLISIREKLDANDFFAIFVSPPSFEILEARIKRRQPHISNEELTHRLDSAKQEISQKNLANEEVISEEGEIDKIVDEVEKIIAE
jgi:guanylate kinase